MKACQSESRGGEPPRGGSKPPDGHHANSPIVPRTIFPLKFATWNTASLLGGLHTEPARWRAKRSALQRLLENTRIACLQEVRGVAADLHFLPDSHIYFHSLMPASAAGLSSREGGVAVAVHRDFMGEMDEITETELRRGRVFALRMRRGTDHLHIVCVHMDLALPHRARAACLREIRAYLDRFSGEAALLGGDWNFVHSDETRLRDGADEVRAHRSEAETFDALFEDMGELFQPHMTFSHGSVETAMVHSRLDR